MAVVSAGSSAGEADLERPSTSATSGWRTSTSAEAGARQASSASHLGGGSDSLGRIFDRTRGQCLGNRFSLSSDIY